MSAYYEPSQWPPTGQPGWDHQTPPPARSGANSAVPREEPAAFTHQLEEVDRAVDNLVKSGKMFGVAGGRHGRPPAGPGSRPHSMADFGDARGPHPGSNLQNFYASQRHQSSRGSNEAEQMMQAKRRMAAQRERELRNYHQEQQYNRTVLAEMYGNKPDRALSPSMSEDERRKLIAQQHSALYGENFGFDENGTRPGPHGGPAGLRGQSPLTYEYGRAPPVHPDTSVQGAPTEGSQSANPNEQSRANSNSSPQSNPSGSKGVFDPPSQQTNRTSASSPGGSPPRQGAPGAPGSNKPTQGSVAPIGTRPSAVANTSSINPALNKRSTTPLPSPLSQGYTAAGAVAGAEENSAPNSAASAPNQSSGAAGSEGGPSVGLTGWGARPNGWGSKPGLGVQASVWG
ncbi:hypothetical protein VTI74DRAFT_11417 [Chaetomium olivicolor]